VPIAELPKNCPRFTVEQETELHARMQAGDQEARDLLARSIMPWAIKVICKFRGRGIADDELEGIAFYAIAETLNRWEPARGRLTTAVVWSIRSAFQKHRADLAGAVHVPVYLLDTSEGGGSHAEQKPEYRKAAKRALSRGHSLDDPMPGRKGNENKTFGSTIVGHDGRSVLNEMIYEEDMEVMRFKYRWAMDRMTKPRLRQILEERWEGGLTLEEVSQLLSVTRERIRQLETKAKQEFAALLEQAPEPVIEHRPMSNGLISSFNRDDSSLSVPGNIGALRDVNLTEALAVKTPRDIANEIASLDKQFEALEQNYRGKRDMLKVLHKALLKRDQTKLSPNGEANASGSGGDKCLAVYNYLRNKPSSNVNQIIAATGFTKSTVNYLLAYHRNKKFKKVERGRWSIVPGGFKDDDDE
jgi:RNA polymerase sigma factor (sigma-70 family)